MPSVLSDQERLFQIYLAMGPGRSHSKLQKLVSEDPQKYGLAYAPSLRNIREWSSWGQWNRRIRDPAELERERAERQRVERIEEHHERLYQQGLQLQERGAELLRGLPANGIRLKDAVDTIQAGLNLEAFSLMTSEDKVPLLALGEEQLKRLTDADANTLIRLLQKAVGDAPEKRYKPPKTKPYPWQYDFEKIPYMTQQEKAAHQRKVDTERRARGYGTQDISSIW